MDWSYFSKFEPIVDKYMPSYGEGESMASQMVTAVNKLIYKWYNDGDVFDNTHYLSGWANDLSSYANWLYKYVPKTVPILDSIKDCHNGVEYEELLVKLADTCLDDVSLTFIDCWGKVGSIYDCEGPFRFDTPDDDDDDDWLCEECEDECWEEDDEDDD